MIFVSHCQCKISKMHFTIFLISVIVPFARADDCGNAPAAVDEKNFGKDIFCVLAFRSWVVESYMKESVPSAKKYGLGKLSDYRYDYAYVEGIGAYSTLEPEQGSVAWGIAYLIPTSDYELTKEQASHHNGVRLTHSVKVNIEVTVDNQCLNVPCNMFPTIAKADKADPLPDERKPRKVDLDFVVNAYGKVGIPADYITKISKIPTSDC